MKLRIGARGKRSALSQAQNRMVEEELRCRRPDISVEFHIIETLGDKKQGTVAAEFGDKKDWILELEQAVLRGDVDFAVHCGKDVPVDIAAGTVLMPILQRADPRDAFIGRKISGGRLRFADIPYGGKVGTSSLRRSAELRRIRPDLNVVSHRGNVTSRIEKLDSSDLDGIILACAGLLRLGIVEDEYEPLLIDQLLPTMNQGALVTQVLGERFEIIELLKVIQDPKGNAPFLAERRCIEVLGADCHSAVSAYAEESDGSLTVRARVFSLSGDTMIEESASGKPDDALVLGETIARGILSRGGAALLEESRLERSRDAERQRRVQG